MNAGRIREYAETTPPRSLFKHARSVPEQRDIATKTIYQESANQRGLPGLQKLKRAGDGRKHAAPVDIGDKDAWRFDADGKTEIHEIAVFKIQLRNAAGAFNDDVIVTRCKAFIALHHRITEKIKLLVIFSGR